MAARDIAASGSVISASASDRIFFSLAGAWFVLLATVGFWESFYFRSLPDPLPTHRIVHGVIFSAWVLLFFVQALLIAAQRTRLHMSLGLAGVFLLLVMVPTGFYVVLAKTAVGDKSIAETGFNLAELTLGFLFAGVGLANRRRPAIHKRLMLFATVMLTVAAADRVAMALGVEEVRLFRKLLAVVPAIAIVAYDAFYRRRIVALSVGLLAVVWVLLWYVVSDLVFEHAAGEMIIRALIRLFAL